MAMLVIFEIKKISGLFDHLMSSVLQNSHNYLISARYEMINHTEFKLYVSTDAGLNKSISKELQVGSKKEQNTGITACISFGAEFAISRSTLLGANIQSQ